MELVAPATVVHSEHLPLHLVELGLAPHLVELGLAPHLVPGLAAAEDLCPLLEGRSVTQPKLKVCF